MGKMRFNSLVFFILFWQVSKCLRFAKLPPVYETISLKLVKNIVKRSVPSALSVNTFSLHGEVGLRARFVVFNRTFDISAARLRRPPSIIDRNIAIQIFDRNQSRSFGYDRMRYYAGRVADISNSKFRGYVGGDGQLAGGLVDTGDEVYHIEPARRYFQSRSAENSLVMVYPGSRVLAQRCGDLTEEPCFADIARGILGPRLKRSSKDFPAKLAPYTYGGPNHFDRICSLHLVADHTFFAQMHHNDANSIHEMMFFVEQANMIFTGSDFNGDGNADGLQLQVQKISLFTEGSSFRPDYFLRDENLEANAILEQFSMFMGRNVKQHCLAVLFTSRDFSPTSLLGLSYIADSNFYGLGGGICELVSKVEGLAHPASLNTAMITTINGGMVLPRSMMSAVLSHLLGHSFGAPNDEASCQESAPEGGTYLMFPFIGVPVLENNLKFSPCSLDRILPVLRNKGWCLEKKSEYGFCGDGVVQAPEECDCGMNQEECDFIDHCCAPAEMGQGACKVRRDLGYVCSPLTSGCCATDTCLPLKVKQFCAPPVDNCIFYGTCNGVSPVCPQIGTRENGEPCAGGAAACDGGYCNNSLCWHLGLEDCDCVLPVEDRCKVCCRAAHHLHACHNVRKIMGHYLGFRLPGSPCMNNTGYCTYDKMCQLVTEEGMVDSEAISHKKLILYPISMWIVNHWLHIFLGIVFLVLLFLIIRGLVIIYRMSVVTYQFTQAVKMGMRRIWAHHKEGDYPYIVLVCAGRLLALFPGVPIEEALEVASHHGSESSMIKLLLGRGYPIRTAFFSTEILEEYQKAPPPI